MEFMKKVAVLMLGSFLTLIGIEHYLEAESILRHVGAVSVVAAGLWNVHMGCKDIL